ncbi:MAG: hypothetical protein HQL77_17585 [Magnetococcales bacterium]|nr:hypothetical protein [Magnetococcales bacterium]
MAEEFLNLPEDQRTALLSLRVQTTFFWPQLVQLAHQRGDSFSCQVREKTYDEIEECLNILSKAGHFKFDFRDDGLPNVNVLTLDVFGVTEKFKQAVCSVEKGIVTENGEGFGIGIIGKIFRGILSGPGRSFFLLR